MHATLTSKNNLRLLLIWVLACGVTGVFFMRPMLWLFFLLGTTLGSLAGYLQLIALRQSGRQLVTADSAVSVRRALQTSPWGRMYLVVFWVGNLTIILLSLVVYQREMIAGWVAGYCSFALLRELITLSGTYELQRLENAGAGRAA
jgi:hypothetical protein